MAIGCSPATIQPAVATVPEVQQATAIQFRCVARQPDLSVGTVVYSKGLATVNGTALVKGAPLRHGDTVATPVDGFAVVMLGSGNLVNIDPATTITVNCMPTTLDSADDLRYTVSGPHMSGAIRG